VHKLIYVSRAAPGTDAQLPSLLTQARDRNLSLSLTGMLIFAHGSFMQQLEGSLEDVDTVFASIERDDRHTDIRLLARESIERRRFADWSMGFEHPSDDTLAESLPGFKASITYPLVNPELISNATVAETLLELYARNG
jgi:hypothetical protein